MKYRINGYMTDVGAAYLMVSGQIDLLTKWTDRQAYEILKQITKISISDLVSIADCTKGIEPISSNNIPQFGSVESIINVPTCMVNENKNGLDYIQLGFLLKKDPKAKLSANQKYGENYGKVASQVGLINCLEKHFYFSPITEAFVKDFTEEEQMAIVTRLFMRIPIIQLLIKEAKNKTVNGYEMMGELCLSTMKRRGSCIKNVLKCFEIENEKEMNQRIKNIMWM